MRVLFIVHDPAHVAARYRVMQFIPGLEAEGISCRVARRPDGWRGWRALWKDGGFDVVYFQKKPIRWRDAFWCRRRRARVIYDFDDAVMFGSPRRGRPRSLCRLWKFRSSLSRADAVVAGSAHLRSLAEPYHPRVVVIPTCVDEKKYGVGPARGRGRPSGDPGAPETCALPAGLPAGPALTLGWIGGRKSLLFLKALGAVLDGLAGEVPGLRLKIVCNEFFDLPNLPVEKVAWSEAREAEEVETFDVGLAPLPDDPWSRGKCGTKLLQCMASAVPCVASAVGSHREIVRDGEDGFLVSDDAGWRERIRLLARDPGLRARIGLAARRRVEEAYSLGRWVPVMAEVLRG